MSDGKGTAPPTPAPPLVQVCLSQGARFVPLLLAAAARPPVLAPGEAPVGAARGAGGAWGGLAGGGVGGIGGGGGGGDGGDAAEGAAARAEEDVTAAFELQVRALGFQGLLIFMG